MTGTAEVLARLRIAYDAELAKAEGATGELAIITDGDALPRIVRLRRFAAWLAKQGRAEESATITRTVAMLAGGLDKYGESERLHERLRDAEHKAFVMTAKPHIERDAKRQRGTRKPRGSRMPLLDAMLDDAIKRTPHATNDELWDGFDLRSSMLERDGETLIEWVDDKPRQTGRAGFDKRVAAARKRAQKRR